MHFEREFHAVIFEDIEDRIPHFGDVIETVLNGFGGHGRETVKHVPDRGAGESGDDLHLEIGGGFGGEFHLFDRPFAFGFGLAGEFFRAEHIGTLVVVRIADQLSGEMVADGEELEVAAGEFVEDGFAVFFILGGSGHVEVVAGAGEFDAVIAPGSGFFHESIQRHIRPLSGKKGDRSHVLSLLCLIGFSRAI